ncbi:MAG: alcohol dehydrogenase catalytic domain-containing protein [Planctomycetaceae bacterium]
MRAALLETFSGPAGVRVVELPVPVPRRGEILVRVICSPVNPSDVLYCSGTYASPPTLPVVPGFEGCGIVVASGGGGKKPRHRKNTPANGRAATA